MNSKLPNLVLSYTYFLDDIQNSSISVGYDSNLFIPTILLVKNTKCFKVIEFSVYVNIYTLREEINKFFNGDKSAIIHKNEFFVLSRNDPKTITIRDCNGKIMLNEKQWSRLYKLMPFLTSVANYQNRTAYLVADYYESYLKQCLIHKVLKLDNPPNIPYEIESNTINYSRLFHEIPILCETKLFDDYFKNVIQESINTSIN